MIQTQPKILISAGEASGDQLGAYLAAAIKAQQENAILYGMGGTRMAAAGVNIVADLEKVSVVGIVEVLTHLGDILETRKKLIQCFKTNPPDLLILIDLPDFNLNLAKQAKKHGIKVMYYVSPQIWAWRYNRIKKIKRQVDHMAVLFAFEKAFYDREKIPATFVGHPLMEKAKATMSPDAAYRAFQLDEQQPIIALLPGSRHSEIKRLMPTLIQAAQRIQRRIPRAQFVLPLAPSLTPEVVKPYLIPSIHVIEENFHNLLSISQVAITVSGTATLEVALHQVPLVVIYKMSALTYQIAKWLVKTPYIALCNIVAEEYVAREFIQADAHAKNIADEALRLLNDKTYRQAKLAQLQKLKEKAGEPGASERAAAVALKLLSE